MSQWSNITQNRISDKNYRAPSTLSAGAEWNTSGSFESCHNFACISVIIKSTSNNTIGYLYCDESRDGTTVFRTIQHRIMDEEIGRVFMLPITNAYFRLRFKAATIIDSRSTPIANDWTALEIVTKLNIDPLTVYDFVLGKRVYSIKAYDNGNNVSRLPLYGLNYTQATYPLPTVNSDLYVINDQTTNSSSGTGARTFLVIGTNANFDEIFWKGDFVSSSSNPSGVGVGISLCPSTTFTRVNEFYFLTFGTTLAPSASSTFYIAIKDSGTWKNISLIASVFNWMVPLPVYTLPNGYTRGKMLNRLEAVSSTGLAAYHMILKRVPGSSTVVRYPLYMSNDYYSTGQAIADTNGLFQPSLATGDTFVLQAQQGSAYWIHAHIGFEIS